VSRRWSRRIHGGFRATPYGCASSGSRKSPLPPSSILKLSLSYDPSRIERNRFRCHLYNTGGKCASIQNIHFKGFASFGDRTDTYLPFVRTLISRIAALRPRCEFVAGTSHLLWWANAAFITVTFSFLAIVMFYLFTAIGPWVILKLIIIAFFIPTVISWFIKNWPKRFSPHAIPENLLPKG
jgi:hypothetical protein